MTSKPVIPRAVASRDVDAAIEHYLAEGSPAAASGFIDALEQAFQHIARHPATGSPRYAHELNLPELRCWALRRYPYLVFYVDCPDRIDVWRVLHGKRDIPSWLQEAS
ncbi:MAG TPA: type II toxin-antitoxin system RelE/ParE family toxin [Plasticicumulans sp.]|nr:type II toxin-antitoxin system RelE/ParE family toxin [Plasticicumulans sp.]